MASDGRYGIVWRSSFPTDGGGIHGRLYANDGTPLGSEFKVRQNTSNGSSSPDIAMGADGRFVVTWQNIASVDYIHAQRYNSDGDPLGVLPW